MSPMHDCLTKVLQWPHHFANALVLWVLRKKRRFFYRNGTQEVEKKSRADKPRLQIQYWHRAEELKYVIYDVIRQLLTLPMTGLLFITPVQAFGVMHANALLMQYHYFYCRQYGQ